MYQGAEKKALHRPLPFKAVYYNAIKRGTAVNQPRDSSIIIITVSHLWIMNQMTTPSISAYSDLLLLGRDGDDNVAWLKRRLVVVS